MAIQTNKQVVKEFYNSFKNKGQDYNNFCHDHIEQIAMDGMPDGGRYVGLNQFLENIFLECYQTLENPIPIPTEFLSIYDDRVIILANIMTNQN